jgi:hypothetical protein
MDQPRSKDHQANKYQHLSKLLWLNLCELSILQRCLLLSLQSLCSLDDQIG